MRCKFYLLVFHVSRRPEYWAESSISAESTALRRKLKARRDCSHHFIGGVDTEFSFPKNEVPQTVTYRTR